MRYITARQMVFDAYHYRRGNSPAASYFDRAQKIGKEIGSNGSKLRSLIAEHKRNVRALANAGPFDEDLSQLKMAVRRTEKRLSEIRTTLDDTTRSSNEGIRDNDWRIVHGLEAGAVISRVESLPIHIHALILICYAPRSRSELDPEHETLTIALYRTALSQGIRLPGQGKTAFPTSEQLEMFRYLCAAAIHHYAEITWPYLRNGLSTPQAVRKWMQEEHGVKLVGRWSTHDRTGWCDVWSRIGWLLDDWDSVGLTSVSELLQKKCA